MQHKRIYWALLLLPMALAGKARQNTPQPRRLLVRSGGIGEDGSLFVSDFATPAQQKGFDLLKAGKLKDALIVFTQQLPMDRTGLAAVGLAQATSPDEWPKQIRQLQQQYSLKPDDVRLGFRLGTLLYYDSISQTNGGYMPDTTEFDRATVLLAELWKRSHDPLTGMMLTEMAFRFHTNDSLRRTALLESLVGIVGGNAAQNAYFRARQYQFNVPPPDPSLVPVERRKALAGVLCGLWTEATKITGTMAVFDNHGKMIPADQRVMKNDPVPLLQKRQAAYLDRWIKSLNPKLGKHS